MLKTCSGNGYTQYDGSRATAPEIGSDHCRNRADNEYSDRLLSQDARRCGRKRYAGTDGGPAQDAACEKRSGGASRTFRLTPPTPCTECSLCILFSWMPIWSNIPTASSGSLRWTRCRQQRISSTGSFRAETFRELRHLAEISGGYIPSCYVARLYDWDADMERLQEMRGRLNGPACPEAPQQVQQLRERIWKTENRMVREAEKVLESDPEFPCGKPTSRNSMPSCRP